MCLHGDVSRLAMSRPPVLNPGDIIQGGDSFGDTVIANSTLLVQLRMLLFASIW
jgi:hypothetical protein